MSKVVSFSFAGKRPCKDCGSTTTRRGWVSATDEVSCATRTACEKRQLMAWKAKHPECYALKHRPVPGGFCSACRPTWAGGPFEERLCPMCSQPMSPGKETCPRVACQREHRAEKKRASQ